MGWSSLPTVLTATLLVAAGTAFVAGAAPADAADLPADAVAKRKKRKRRFLKVRKVKPGNNRSFVPLDTQIRVRFSRPVDPETVTPDSVRLRALASDDVAYSATYEKNGKVLVLTPTTFLDPARDYGVTIGLGVLSRRGRALKREKRSLFYTDANVLPVHLLRPEQFLELPGRMLEGRGGHSATLLQDGRVLLAGGQTNAVNVTRSAEAFDPATLRFRGIEGTMATPRAFHLGLPQGGGALLTGGWDGIDASDATELFDPLAGEFRSLAPLQEKRDFLAGVTLDDGRVLVVGGLAYGSDGGATYSATAEIYSPASAAWRYTRTMPLDRRAGHAMTVLQDGRVLITGGLRLGTPSGPTAEIFDPLTETFTSTVGPALEHRQLHTATLLASGRVLVADGTSGPAAIYDPTLDRFFEAGFGSAPIRTRATATRLSGGRVLILGGLDGGSSRQPILDSIDLYLANSGGGTGRIVQVDVALDTPRAAHTATVLADGRVLFAGGLGPTDQPSSSSAVLFSPD